MTRKTIGYTRLQWTCPNCGTRNPGPQKTCTSCGYPQPEDVQFEEGSGDLVQDEAELKRARSAPDIHCFYCGARNPADAKTCSQCGGDLTKGTARKAGRVVGAHKKKPAPPITCSSCGASNPADAARCQNCGASLKKPKPRRVAPAAPAQRPAGIPRIFFFLFAGFVILVLLCVFLTVSTSQTTGKVQGVGWTRSIAIEGLVPVEAQGWRNEIPAGAAIGTCTQKVHHVQDSPAPGAQEICGTPYTVDTGTGYGQVVQDCKYQVYADYCTYTTQAWKEVDRISLSGNDYNPRWPSNYTLGFNQREGSRTEKYEIIFDVDGEKYTYTTHDENLFRRAEIGSRWVLHINKLNAVTKIEPTE
ncbi:MAG: zinc ribbon domain-containing protein [Caldilineae bacterium]|nr:MAG: zinc ribbon domain-containing protein [Caldilineae bacterium]